MNLTGIVTDVVNNVSENGLYDILKFVILYFIYKGYEKWYLANKWGDWKVKIFKTLEDTHPETERKLSIPSAKRIIEDEGERSIYLKGLVSPHAKLTIDIVSQDAKDKGLVNIDIVKKVIIVDLSKNPK
jgi:hypothetical protein